MEDNSNKCIECNKDLVKFQKKFCSATCLNNFNWRDNDYRKKQTKSHSGKRGPLSEETRKKIGLANSIALRGYKHTEESRKNNSESKKKLVLEGKHHLWRGGITPINRAIRISFPYRVWRRSVLERDGYKCTWCSTNDKLQADHIKPFSTFPELRFDINNGRTLCIDCHRKTDTWGGKSRIKI